MVIENELIVSKKKKNILVLELEKKDFLTRKAIFMKHVDEFTVSF